jgi:hypothetical protein
MFEDIKAAFNSALDSAAGNEGVSKSLMREAVIEARSAIKYLEESLAKAEAKLKRELKNLDDATRRGGMAAGIGDQETVEVAERFATKHREKVEILERKVDAQKEELAVARREENSMTAQLKAAQRGGPQVRAGSSGSFAPGDNDGALEEEIEKEDSQSLAARQLEELKRRMGK